MIKCKKSKIICVITLFISVILSLSLGFVLKHEKRVSASSELSVSKIAQTADEKYNGKSTGIFTEWQFEFNANEDMFSAYNNGDDITEYLSNGENSNLLSNLKINGVSFASAMSEKNNFILVINKVKENSFKLTVKNFVFEYSEFTFESGFNIGDYVLSDSVTFYENQDWTYTASATRPDFKMFAVYEQPNGSGREFHLVFNDIAVNPATAKLPMDKIYFNGTSLYDLGYREYGESGGNDMGHFVRWESFLNYTDFYFKTALDIESPVISVAENYQTLNGKTISKAQEFNPSHKNCDWNNLAVWTEYDESKIIKISSIEQTSLGYPTTYDFTFDKNVFENVAVNSDLTDTLYSSNDFINNVKVNGNTLKMIIDADKSGIAQASGVIKFIKKGDKVLQLSINNPYIYAEFEFVKGCKIDEKSIPETVVYYENQDNTFTARETRPDFKVFGVFELPTTGNRQIRVVFNAPTGDYVFNLSGIKLNGKELTFSKTGSTDWGYFTNYSEFYITHESISSILAEKIIPYITFEATYVKSDNGTYKSLTSKQIFKTESSAFNADKCVLWTETDSEPSIPQGQELSVNNVKTSVNLGVTINGTYFADEKSGNNYSYVYDSEHRHGTETRFSLFFDKNLFPTKNFGDDITAELSSSFFNGIYLNNASLQTIINSGISIKVYVGSRDFEVYSEQDCTNSIEVIINRVIFNYNVKILCGCQIGDCFITENLFYQKDNANDYSFTELNAFPTVENSKVIAIREDPIASDDRRIYIVYNQDVSSSDNSTTIYQNIKFNGEKVMSEVTGGKYFNPEVFYGGKQMVLIFKKSVFETLTRSENPSITIPSITRKDGGTTSEQTFVLRNGVWQDQNDIDDNIESSDLLRIVYEGQQSGKIGREGKLFQLKFNDGCANYQTDTYLKDNLYLNGVKIKDYICGAGYINPENFHNAKSFAVYIDSELRNYKGGLDVFYLPKGCPMAGGKIIDHDIYFYGLIDKDRFDPNAGYVFNYSSEMPELQIKNGEKVDITSSEISATVKFFGTVAKNDVTFGKYSLKDMSEYILVNGKKLSEYQDSSLTWIDDGVKVILKTSTVSVENGIVKVTFKAGFTTPLGYKFESDKEYLYDTVNCVWGTDFDKIQVAGFEVNTIKSVTELKTIKNGYSFGIEFFRPLVGSTDIIGSKDLASGDNTYKQYTWYHDITQTFDRLLELTALSNSSTSPRYAGYDYTENNIEMLIKLGVRDSILNNLLFNGVSLGDLLKSENSATIENSLIQIDLFNNSLNVYIFNGSKLYDTIGDGFNFTLGKGIIFESANSLDKTVTYELKSLENKVFTEKSEGGEQSEEKIIGILIDVTKTEYELNEEIDLSTVKVNYKLEGNKTGDEVDVSVDMISGFDTTKAGKCTVTVKVGDYSDSFIITVKDNSGNNNGEGGGNGTNEQNTGCFSALTLSSNVLTVLTVTALLSAVIVIKNKKKNRG